MRSIRARHINTTGQTLVVLMLIVFGIVAAVTIAIMASATADVSGSYTDRDWRQAMVNAEAGVEDAKIKIVRNPTTSSCAAVSPCTLTFMTGNSCAIYFYSIGAPGASITSTGKAGTATRALVINVSIDANGVVSQTSWTESANPGSITC